MNKFGMVHNNSTKIEFVEALKKRIFKWVLEISNFCETLPESYSASVFGRQLTRSSASTDANHRVATRTRSNREFYAKMNIAVEEADEITRILSKARHKSGQSFKRH